MLNQHIKIPFILSLLVIFPFITSSAPLNGSSVLISDDVEEVAEESTPDVPIETDSETPEPVPPQYVQTLTFAQLIIFVLVVAAAILIIITFILLLGGKITVGRRNKRYFSLTKDDGTSQDIYIPQNQADGIFLLVYAFRIKEKVDEINRTTTKRQKRRVIDTLNHLKEIILIAFQDAKYENEHKTNVEYKEGDDVQFLLFSFNVDHLHSDLLEKIMFDIEEETSDKLANSEYQKTRSEQLYLIVIDSINRFHHDRRTDYSIRGKITQNVEQKKMSIIEKIRMLYEQIQQMEEDRIYNKNQLEDQLVNTIANMYQMNPDSVRMIISTIEKDTQVNFNSDNHRSSIFNENTSK